MQTTTTVTASETAKVSTSNVNQKNGIQVDQEKDQSNTQDSFIRIFYPKFEWSDTLEFFGFIFLFIIVAVVICEVGIFSDQHYYNIPDDAFLYRYQCLIYCMMLSISIIAWEVIIMFGSVVFVLIVQYIYHTCVNYYYVEGRNSYRWWQKKSNIQFIIISIMSLTWFVMAVESFFAMLPNDKEDRLFKNRFSFYQSVQTYIIVFYPLLASMVQFVQLVMAHNRHP